MVRALEPNLRFRNLTEHLTRGERVVEVDARQICRWCGSTGLTVVSIRDDIEEYGPCPFCLVGHMVEFPIKYGADSTGPWGTDGYWQGREVPEMTPLFSQNNPEWLSREENVKRWRELAAKMGWAPTPPWTE